METSSVVVVGMSSESSASPVNSLSGRFVCLSPETFWTSPDVCSALTAGLLSTSGSGETEVLETTGVSSFILSSLTVCFVSTTAEGSATVGGCGEVSDSSSCADDDPPKMFGKKDDAGSAFASAASSLIVGALSLADSADSLLVSVVATCTDLLTTSVTLSAADFVACSGDVASFVDSVAASVVGAVVTFVAASVGAGVDSVVTSVEGEAAAFVLGSAEVSLLVAGVAGEATLVVDFTVEASAPDPPKMLVQPEATTPDAAGSEAFVVDAGNFFVY